MHLDKSSLLVLFFREANETVASRLAGLLVRHDFRAFARGKAGLEESDQDKLIDFVTKIAHEDGILGAAVIATVDKAATRGPVQTEHSVGVGNRSAIQLKGLVGGLRVAELDKTVASISIPMLAMCGIRTVIYFQNYGR